MSQQNRTVWIGRSQPEWSAPNESASHIEHAAALDATLFRSFAASDELVLELDEGELRFRCAERA